MEEIQKLIEEKVIRNAHREMILQRRCCSVEVAAHMVDGAFSPRCTGLPLTSAGRWRKLWQGVDGTNDSEQLFVFPFWPP